MGLSIKFTGAADGDDGPFSLASASGWALFGEWADMLPGSFVHVRQLAEDGSCLGTDALADDLTAALAAYPPDESVAHTAQGILDVIGVGDADEVAAVVDDDDDGDTVIDLGGAG